MRGHHDIVYIIKLVTLPCLLVDLSSAASIICVLSESKKFLGKDQSWFQLYLQPQLGFHQHFFPLNHPFGSTVLLIKGENWKFKLVQN